VVGSRSRINVAMDWTDFAADGQATIMLSLLTRHGRASPLVWLTVDTATLKDRRNEYEYQVLVRLADFTEALAACEGARGPMVPASSVGGRGGVVRVAVGV